MRKAIIIAATFFFAMVVTFSITQATGPPTKLVQGLGEITDYLGYDVQFSLEILEVRPDIPTGKKILANHAVLMVDGESYVCSGKGCTTHIVGDCGGEDWEASFTTNDGTLVEVDSSGFVIMGNIYVIQAQKCIIFIGDKGPPFELCWPRINYRCLGPR